MECRLVDVVESGLNEIFIGEIVGTYTEEKFLTNGKPDFNKMKPLILSQPDTPPTARSKNGCQSLERRQKVQSQISNAPMTKTKYIRTHSLLFGSFEFWSLGIVSVFVLRASDLAQAEPLNSDLAQRTRFSNPE